MYILLLKDYSYSLKLKSYLNNIYYFKLTKNECAISGTLPTYATFGSYLQKVTFFNFSLAFTIVYDCIMIIQ
jgi:hypothetical protein